MSGLPILICEDVLSPVSLVTSPQRRQEEGGRTQQRDGRRQPKNESGGEQN